MRPCHNAWRPLAGALSLGVALSATAVSAWPAPTFAQGLGPDAAAVPSAALARNFESLRVVTVADQLIRYLGEVVRWVDRPDARAPESQLAPSVLAAVERHPEAQIATEQRAAAAYGTREAWAGFLPQVSGGVEGGRRSSDAVSTAWGVSQPSYTDNSKAVSLNARQLVWDFGATGFQVDSRLAQELSVQARAQAKRSELTLRALNAWLDLFRAQQLVQAGRMNVLSREQILDFIKEREQLGASAMSDVLRAQARLADAQATAVAAANRLAAAEAVWREFFDSEPPADPALPVVPGLPEGPSYAIPPHAAAVAHASSAAAAPVGIDAQARARWADTSPILTEARRQAEAAQAEARAAAAAVLPSVSFDVSVRRRDLGSGNTPGTDWNAGLSVSQSLFSGGAATARAQQAQQRAREAQLAEINLRRQLERALAQSLSDVRNSTTAVEARKDAAQVAAVALEAVREQFAFRRGSLLDLLRAQEELHQATRDLIDSVVDQTLARYRLLHLASDLAPRFGVPVDAAAPVLPPSLLFPDPPSPFRDDKPAASLTRPP